MSHTPHELADEFPEHVARLHDLKVSNAHFARLAEEYHKVNREIHRIETEVEPATDERTTELRKRRLELKDEVNAMLVTA